MDASNQIFQQLIDDIDQGIIYINQSREFEYINEKANHILGVTVNSSHSHPAGRLNCGDIVILCDNCIGYDDGGLMPEDLSVINIYDENIKAKDMFVGIGVYNNREIEPMYRNLPNDHISKNLVLKVQYLSFQIEAAIYNKERMLSIKVNGVSYDMSFMRSAAHIVVIDGVTGGVKFFQAKGYTIKHEDLRYILKGAEYRAKGRYSKSFSLLGQNYKTVIDDDVLEAHVESALLNGQQPVLNNAIFHINKIIVLCSVKPVTINGKIQGVILKIIDTSEMELLIKLRNDTIEKMEKVCVPFHRQQPELPENFMERLVGISSALKRVKALSYKATRTNSNILITGESGTGKSQLAYEIHNFCRHGKPFVEVNCSAIPPSLIESELFGYVGGAFTGALPKGKVGYFERANGGTIFLDEIGDLPLDMQVKLLQVLQNKRFYKVGSSIPISIDLRVISATNRNLAVAVQNGTFRQDLFFRLNVFPIDIPPLRERKVDIYLLVNKISQRICAEYDLPGKQFSGAALNKLVHYDWPGNIRELENVIERAIAIADHDMIYPEYIDIASEEREKTLKDILAYAEKKPFKRPSKRQAEIMREQSRIWAFPRLVSTKN